MRSLGFSITFILPRKRVQVCKQEEIYLPLGQSMREDGERLLDHDQSLLPSHAGPRRNIFESSPRQK